MACSEGLGKSCTGAGRWRAQRDSASLVREQADGVLRGTRQVLYGSRPMAYSASRLSSVAAYGRLLPLYAAALSTPSTSSRDHGGRSTACRPNYSHSQPWRLVCTAQRHKGGARRAGDSRGAVHTKCQGGHSTAQHSTAQHSTAQHRKSKVPALRAHRQTSASSFATADQIHTTEHQGRARHNPGVKRLAQH
jgi:hypothetical protein